MDISVLEKLGLTKAEINVYLSLLEIGSTKVGLVIRKSGLQSSVVHNVLYSLIEQGLVSYVKKGKIKVYQAVAPRKILEMIEDQKKKFLSVLPELELKHKLSGEKEEAEVFEGRKGVMNMLNILIDDVKKDEEYLFFAIDVEENEEVQNFFLNYDLKRKEKNLIVKGLADLRLKKLFNGRKMKMKYPKIPIPSNISICHGKIAFFSWGEKPVGYMIRSKQIVDIYQNYFGRVWKITKPTDKFI